MAKLAAAVTLAGTFTPGCYSSTGAMDIVASTTVTLNGAGTYIFRPVGALTTGANSIVSLTGGATAFDVFWTPSAAVTLGANSTFKGTVIDAAGIAIGSTVAWTGRALAFGGTISTNADTIIVPTAPDITAPTVIVTMDDAVLNIGDTSLVTFTFSETPVGFTTADVTVANGSIGAIDASNPLIQTATYTPTNGITDATNIITVGTAWTDAALNAGVGDDSPNYTIDTVAPAPRLIVNKIVVNDNGGAKVISDFLLFIDGVSVSSGVASTTTTGLHTVSETSDSGYTATIGGNCDADGTITLALGDVKTCTITNDDIAPVIVTPLSNSSGGGGRSSYYALVPPLIDVVKVPSPLALPDGPGTVKYNYTLRNIGAVSVSNITMVGDTCSPIVRVSGDTDSDNYLDVTETWVYTCSTTLSKTHTNIVTTIGWANGISATDIASATVVVGVPIVPPLIHVTKIPSPFALAVAGGAVTYTYTVTNPGTAALNNIGITDDECTGLPARVVGHPGDLNKNDLLESNETWKFTCKSNLTKTTASTSTASGSANGLTATDFAIATVVVNAAVPKLPNTGLPSSEDNIPWNIIVPAGIFAVSLFLYFARRKQTA